MVVVKGGVNGLDASVAWEVGVEARLLKGKGIISGVNVGDNCRCIYLKV